MNVHVRAPRKEPLALQLRVESDGAASAKPLRCIILRLTIRLLHLESSRFFFSDQMLNHFQLVSRRELSCSTISRKARLVSNFPCSDIFETISSRSNPLRTCSSTRKEEDGNSGILWRGQSRIRLARDEKGSRVGLDDYPCSPPPISHGFVRVTYLTCSPAKKCLPCVRRSTWSRGEEDPMQVGTTAPGECSHARQVGRLAVLPCAMLDDEISRGKG